MSLSRADQAIILWRKVLGEEFVITDGLQIREAETATFKTSQKILGILRPHSIEDIQEIIKIATVYKTSLYTISTGKNWGYGSRIPIKNKSFLLDLSKMNRILDYNEELGYITVEPGVTQKQVYDFLKKNKGIFCLSTTGSAPNSSIIGNICERGWGLGPYSFRSHYISALEVILPSGKCIHTGFGRFANALATNVYPEGIGPSFIDTFIQSNLGIITKLTLYLAPRPVYTQFIELYISGDKQLLKFLKILHKFNFYTNSNKSITFYNDYYELAMKTQYPWGITKGITPLPSEIVMHLKKKYKINCTWRGGVEINGYTRQEVNVQIQYFKSLTKKMDGFDISPLYRSNGSEDRPANIDISTYWRMKTKPPRIKNPDLDGCGKIRISLAVPYTVDRIKKVIDMSIEVVTQFGYEPFIEIQCLSTRYVLVVTTILFDRTIEGEDSKALLCHDTLLKLCMKQGYYPYRYNVHSMRSIPKSTDEYDNFQRTIKNALDPLNILSPGRYEIIK